MLAVHQNGRPVMDADSHVDDEIEALVQLKSHGLKKLKKSQLIFKANWLRSAYMYAQSDYDRLFSVAEKVTRYGKEGIAGGDWEELVKMVDRERIAREGCPECLAPADDCPDPRDLAGQPIGMFHCQNCGVMQVAGMPHVNCERCGGSG